MDEVMKCRNCGKKLPSNKYCMHCGCNNNVSEDAAKEELSEEVKEESIQLTSHQKSSDIRLQFSFVVVALMVIVVGFIFGGFDGLFYKKLDENVLVENSVKDLMDADKNLYSLKDGKIYYTDYFADKDEDS